MMACALIGASCQENGTDPQSADLDAKLLTLKRWVLRFCCAIGNRETDFSPSACRIPSNCRIFSRMRKCHAAAGMSWWLRPTTRGNCFGWKGCGFRNDSSLQKRPNAACNGAGNGFNSARRVTIWTHSGALRTGAHYAIIVLKWLRLWVA